MERFWQPPKIWDGGTCWIIGGGSSIPRQFGVPESIIQKVVEGKDTPEVYSDYLAPLHDKHVIGINNAYQIGNWIDMCFFGDNGWYRIHRKKFQETFTGLKISCAPFLASLRGDQRETIKYMMHRRDGQRFGICPIPGSVYWNGNSGAASLSLAYQLGVKKIYLLGFDMNLGSGKESHWHDRPGKSPVAKEAREKRFSKTYRKHLQCFDKVAKDAEKLDLEIINLSPLSAISQFRKSTVKEVLNL